MSSGRSHEEQTRGRDARQHLQFILLTTDQLDDVMAALAFLKTVPGIDSHRIALAGHSFGGQLTLLAAERDQTIRALVTFAGAAGSWEHSSELRERLLTTSGKGIRFEHAYSWITRNTVGNAQNSLQVRTPISILINSILQDFPGCKTALLLDNHKWGLHNRVYQPIRRFRSRGGF